MLTLCKIDGKAYDALITAIEENFNVEIPEYELGKFQTLNDLYNYISTKARA